MDASIKSMNGFSFGILSAMIVTATLFVTLPVLTQLQKQSKTPVKNESVLLNIKRPPPLPSEERDDPIKQTMPEKQIIERKELVRQLKPKFDIPKGNPFTVTNSDIEISRATTLEDVIAIPDRTYNPEDVDQPPRLLRSFPLNYPYIAKRNNQEGWVMLQFVVDTEGSVGKAEVVAAEPEGIFDQAALKAVARYKFKPAVKSGRAVNCTMKQRINFKLD